MERPSTPISGSPRPSPAPATIFVQAEPHTFRDLVQQHTGAPPFTAATPSARFDFIGPRRPSFKLQERRPSLRRLEIKLGLSSLHHSQPSPKSPPAPTTPGQPYFLLAGAATAPFPSPVTPLWSGPVFSPAVSDEDRVIAEKGFYIHPSTPRGSDPPELLPLFPLSSPREKDGGGHEQK